MRKLLSFVIVLGSLSLAVVAPVAGSTETRTVTLAVENMTCALCPITIRKALEKVDGVIEASASLETKTATVTFDPAKATVEALTKATTNAGYPSKLKE